jgi:hypothetical protein
MDGGTVEARLEHVTLYANGARVRRVTKIEGSVPQRLRIAGLPLSVIDDTVRIEVDGPAMATNVRAGVDVPATDATAAEDLPEVAAGKRKVALADAEVERLRGALERNGGAPIIEDDPSEEAPAAWAQIVAARRAVVALRAERELALRDQLAAAGRVAEEARRALQAALDREHRTGTAKPAKPHELRKFVDVELASTGDGAITVRLEYLVGAARWAPSYVARLDADKVTVEMRAVVAQATGEDWAGVPLALSTAEPTRFSLLPELHAQRIGRRQQPPARAGFRAAPAGSEQLYTDYDRERVPARKSGDTKPKPFGDRSVLEESTYVGRPPAETEASPDFGGDSFDGLEQEVWDEESSAAKEAFKTPTSGYALPAGYAQSAPAPSAEASVPRGGMALAKSAKGMMRSVGRRDEKKRGEHGGEGGGGGPADMTRATSEPPAPRLDYGSLVMAPPTSPRRGKLVMATPDRAAGDAEREAGAAQARILALPLPRGCRADWAHSYDYAYATDGAVDVRADGGWHSIAVTAHGSTAKLRHVAVPREQTEVFRVAAIANPFAGPLLPGPIDVYDRGRFLVTSEVDYTPPGASVEVGLGVDATVKLARNTEFREEATGMLRGQLRLHHSIAVDVENLSGRPIDLEVRERIPVTREGDDDIEVTLGKVDPAWERWTPDPDAPREQRLRGAYRWRVALPAGQKTSLRAAYEVKIAGKLELVGGNRRES